MTEMDIIKILSRWIDESKHPYQICNAFIYSWESDYWVMTAEGETREFEIKISRSDYLCDAKKEKHASLSGANYFYYVCPKDLITKLEIDNRYGLIYISKEGYVDLVKKPKRLHSQSFDKWKHLANKMYWRYRQVWKEKYIKKEITYQEYQEGFNLQLCQEDLATPKSSI